MYIKKVKLALAGFAIMGMNITMTASACTGIQLTAEDGAVIRARTMEFGVDLQSNILVVPRGYERTATAPKGKKGLQWKSKYASLGANGSGTPLLMDGVNEKGLSMGLFYHPGTADYMPYNEKDTSKTLAPWELGSYILENFATTEEVKQKLKEVVVPAVIFADMGYVPPIHYVVYDASGKSIVIEFIKGKMLVQDNPLGVLTNSPSFDWHMTNLRNYINISLTPIKAIKLKNVTLNSFGMGSGLVGIPGDFTPPSRFVRAALFSQMVLPSKTGYDTVLQAFHLLNNFDIPKGSARDEKKDTNGNIVADYTEWTSAVDLKSKKYYFRTYENSQIRMVDLTKFDLDAKEIITIEFGGKEVVKELTMPHKNSKTKKELK